MKFETQNNKIKRWLLDGNSITVEEAKSLFRISNLHSRLSDLRSEGLPILKEMVFDGKNTYPRYRIPQQYLAIIKTNARQTNQVTNQPDTSVAGTQKKRDTPSKRQHKPKNVYILTRKVYNRNSLTGQVFLWESSIAGVFADAISALEFCEKIIKGMEFSTKKRSFEIYARKSGESCNFLFSYSQQEHNLYPSFVFECTREVCFTKGR